MYPTIRSQQLFMLADAQPNHFFLLVQFDRGHTVQRSSPSTNNTNQYQQHWEDDGTSEKNNAAEAVSSGRINRRLRGSYFPLLSKIDCDGYRKSHSTASGINRQAICQRKVIAIRLTLSLVQDFGFPMCEILLISLFEVFSGITHAFVLTCLLQCNHFV